MAELPVVICGGGPAGAATAIALRTNNVPVVVLDRRHFPRDKVCGDVLLPDTIAALSTLGLDFQDLASRAYECTGVRYIAPNGREVSGLFSDVLDSPSSWWTLKRVAFDDWLLSKAADLGAEIREGWNVEKIIASGSGLMRAVARTRDGQQEQVKGRVVVGADGASSCVARNIGTFGTSRQHTCLAIRAYATGIRLPQPYLEVFTTCTTLPGCVWIVPVGPNEANIGVGILKADAERLQCTPRQIFESACEQNLPLRERLTTAKFSAFKGWFLPGASQKRRLVGDGYLLVGDAGAMINPFTGHGIHNAIRAGVLAGKVIARLWNRQDFSHEALKVYEEACREQILNETPLYYGLQRLHSLGSIANLLALASRSHSGVRRTLVGLIGHIVTPQELLFPPNLLRVLFGLRLRAMSSKR